MTAPKISLVLVAVLVICNACGAEKPTPTTTPTKTSKSATTGQIATNTLSPLTATPIPVPADTVAPTNTPNTERNETLEPTSASMRLVQTVTREPRITIPEGNMDPWQGVWAGTGLQKNGSSWTIELKVVDNSYTIDYPSLNCGGKLELIDDRNEIKYFQERLDYGLERCVSGGTTVLTLKGSGVLQYDWFYPNGNKDATAMLNLVAEGHLTPGFAEETPSYATYVEETVDVQQESGGVTLTVANMSIMPAQDIPEGLMNQLGSKSTEWLDVAMLVSFLVSVENRTNRTVVVSPDSGTLIAGNQEGIPSIWISEDEKRISPGDYRNYRLFFGLRVPLDLATLEGIRYIMDSPQDEEYNTLGPLFDLAIPIKPRYLIAPTRRPEAFLNCSAVADIPQVECEALVALYNSTDGDNWLDNSKWFTADSPCSWFGVTCQANGHVETLWLDGNQLSGSIPPELGNLTDLSSLILSHNQLSGSIPPELGNLTNLGYLELSGNQLSGSIPSELGNLANLRDLYLRGNQLSGSIPPELGNMTDLEYLYLSGNQLSGSIPPELGNLTWLRSLRLDDNQLSGSIPPVLCNQRSLEIRVSGTKIEPCE